MVREVTGCMRARPSILEMGSEQWEQLLQDLEHPKVHTDSLGASKCHRAVPYIPVMQQTGV
jgi:hypothetical protein